PREEGGPGRRRAADGRLSSQPERVTEAEAHPRSPRAGPAGAIRPGLRRAGPPPPGRPALARDLLRPLSGCAATGRSGSMKTMELTSFTALSFDCYGTLIDWDTGISATLLPWARRHGLELNQRELLVAHAAAEGRAQRENPGELYPDILARSFRGLGAAF